MPKIRVLLVDDSVVVRMAVSAAISADPELEMVGTASNGKIALARIQLTSPDIVILDIEMPVMDGLKTLAAIQDARPALPVIMFSSLTERGAVATLDALALGAADYVTKPSAKDGADGIKQRLCGDLIPKIKALGGRAAEEASSQPWRCEPVLAALDDRIQERPPRRRVGVVAIAVSTGGPNALAQVLPALPAGFPVPIVIVQHMPPLFTRFLAARLAAKAAIGVSEASEGEELRPGHAWLAPGGYHMALRREDRRVKIALNQDPPENFCRPAADVLFRSVADVYGGESLAVVLTGMGQDSLRGCERIREAGGQIVAQDPQTSVVWGMPGSVAKAGLTDEVIPLGEIAARIGSRVALGRSPLSPAGGQADEDGEPCT